MRRRSVLPPVRGDDEWTYSTVTARQGDVELLSASDVALHEANVLLRLVSRHLITDGNVRFSNTGAKTESFLRHALLYPEEILAGTTGGEFFWSAASQEVHLGLRFMKSLEVLTIPSVRATEESVPADLVLAARLNRFWQYYLSAAASPLWTPAAGIPLGRMAAAQAGAAIYFMPDPEDL